MTDLNNWEEEFDNQFPEVFGEEYTTWGGRDQVLEARQDISGDLKTFIKSLLQAQREKVIEECMEKVRGIDLSAMTSQSTKRLTLLILESLK